MILLVDKPSGITSFDVIRRLRRKLGVKKMGHAGTLDPLASGLMIIGVGEDTKKLHQFLRMPKKYEAEVLFGIRTETGDITGKIIEKLKVKDQNEDTVKKILKDMVGKIELPVPVYSAVKRGGEPLYKKARRGEKFNPPIKTMEVRGTELLDIFETPEGPVAKIIFAVGSGAYIRSLGEELGRRLGAPATIRSLRRTGVGDFRVEAAEKL